jgi:hypothetical protein
MTRAEINRLNAQKSTGPRTQEGKQKSSLNALRHGLTSHLRVLPGEDPELYQLHLRTFLDEYDPQSVTELLEIQKENKQENAAGFVFTEPVPEAPELREIPPTNDNSPAHLHPETDDAVH